MDNLQDKIKKQDEIILIKDHEYDELKKENKELKLNLYGVNDNRTDSGIILKPPTRQDYISEIEGLKEEIKKIEDIVSWTKDGSCWEMDTLVETIDSINSNLQSHMDDKRKVGSLALEMGVKIRGSNPLQSSAEVNFLALKEKKDEEIKKLKIEVDSNWASVHQSAETLSDFKDKVYSMVSGCQAEELEEWEKTALGKGGGFDINPKKNVVVKSVREPNKKSKEFLKNIGEWE
jgi:hypothetical protein